MATKLDILYSRNLYQLAIHFGESAHLAGPQVNTIVAKYADHLFSRNEYDAAITQYLRALAVINPSEVIRKFLDVQRIGNLVQILEELHSHQLANSDHTTLLVNCYARLKNTEQLEQFIRAEGGVEFDVDTAIQVCRQGRYYEQAAFLAQKYGEHDTFISILVENLKQYSRALKFIKTLQPSEVPQQLFLRHFTDVGRNESPRIWPNIPCRMA
jgi:vacuolar protein sorting-associated protein 11